jgi:hypothetical protein
MGEAEGRGHKNREITLKVKMDCEPLESNEARFSTEASTSLNTIFIKGLWRSQ